MVSGGAVEWCGERAVMLAVAAVVCAASVSALVCCC